MRLIIIPFRDGDNDGTEYGLEISRWLKSMDLKLGKDFTWSKMSKNRELHFMFDQTADQYATMLVMKER